MTENKRFIETISTGIVMDTVTEKEYNCEMRIDDDFLNLVNTIAEENEQLKMENNSLKLLVQNWEALDEEKEGQLDKQNQALKKLKKENEKLKEEIEFWKKHCITHGIAVPITWGDKND